MFKVAPGLDKRSAQEEENMRRMIEAGGGIERWGGVNEGYYNGFFYPDHSQNGEVQLRGFELALAVAIEDLCLQKEERFVVVDFGAMAAITMLRIAKKLEHLIQDERLVVIATSLQFLPEKCTPEQLAFYFRIRGALALYQGNPHLVHYVNASAQSLKNTEVALPSGGIVRLSDGIDFFHEKWSLSLNGKVLDRDLPEIGQLVARSQGMMALEHLGFEDVDLHVRYGLENLIRCGMRFMGFSKGGGIKIFSAGSSEETQNAFRFILKKDEADQSDYHDVEKDLKAERSRQSRLAA